MTILPIPAEGRIKINSPEHSLNVQRALIGEGINWPCRTAPHAINVKYLFWQNGTINWGVRDDTFTSSPLPEYTFDGVNFNRVIQVPEFGRLAPRSPDEMKQVQLTLLAAGYQWAGLSTKPGYFYHPELQWHKNKTMTVARPLYPRASVDCGAYPLYTFEADGFTVAPPKIEVPECGIMYPANPVAMERIQIALFGAGLHWQHLPDDRTPDLLRARVVVWDRGVVWVRGTYTDLTKIEQGFPVYGFDGTKFTEVVRTHVPTQNTPESEPSYFYSLKLPRRLRRGYDQPIATSPEGITDLVRHLGRTTGDVPGHGCGFESLVLSKYTHGQGYIEYSYVDGHGHTCSGAIKVRRHPVV